ncbi:MAG: class I SAM-dependent methyltransferase [Anaerolineaceae bacterium]
MENQEIKQEVRTFYDQIGWQVVSDGMYQNARYEDLRRVSAEYIHNCHLRINRHLIRPGRFLLDAGCGPIQYPEYLTYSDGYEKRVCLDISIVALKEARTRIGNKGLFVVADVSNLPFPAGIFEGQVSLHTLHHLPIHDQKKAFLELYRTLASGRNAAIVNGWTVSPLMNLLKPLMLFMERIGRLFEKTSQGETKPLEKPATTSVQKEASGTFINKFDPAWLATELGGVLRYEILIWRSVSVRFLRAVYHQALLGRLGLRILYNLEEKYPHWFGTKGQYPLVVIKK